MGKGRRWSGVINVDIKMNEAGVEVSEEATEMGCVDLISGNSYLQQGAILCCQERKYLCYEILKLYSEVS